MSPRTGRPRAPPGNTEGAGTRDGPGPFRFLPSHRPGARAGGRSGSAQPPWLVRSPASPSAETRKRIHIPWLPCAGT